MPIVTLYVNPDENDGLPWIKAHLNRNIANAMGQDFAIGPGWGNDEGKCIRGRFIQEDEAREYARLKREAGV